MARTAALGALLLLLAISTDASITLEHSLDGGKTFTKSGVIEVRVARGAGTAVLERSPMTPEQQLALGQLVAGDGLYRLRLPSVRGQAGGQPVSTSFPARCLAGAAADGGLELDLLDASQVAAIALSAPCRRAAASAAADLQLPDRQELALRLPTVAPEVLPVVLPPAQAAAAAAAAVGMPSDPAAGQQQTGQGSVAGAGPAGGKQAGGKKESEEEKTWLQKNWMLLMPLGFILMNLLGNGAGAQQQQGGQQRPGGAAPVRVIPPRR